jgi:hypothetical protein
MTYKTIEEWIERNPGHIGAIPIEVCRQIWGTKDAQNMASKSTYKEQLETKDEPVGWIDSKGYMICVKTDESCRPLYTTPQRTWVGLSEDEIHECFEECCNLKVVDPKGGVRGSVNIFDVGRAIEAKLKDKNNV